MYVFTYDICVYLRIRLTEFLDASTDCLGRQIAIKIEIGMAFDAFT